MATVLLNGQTTWSLQRDQDGHRNYTVRFLVAGLSTDGPFTVLNTPGLPQPGDWWLIDGDADLWALCWPTARVTPRLEGEPNQLWDVELQFSTKPLWRCNDESVQDPLLIPQKISGTFVKYTEEAFTNRFGTVLTNSAWERLTGPQVEFDRNRPSVKIEQNVASLDLPLLTAMVDTVNAFPLWGLPRRCIKLSNVSWERQFHGQCYVYYSRTLEFDVSFETFDRNLMDEGTKVLNGHWDAVTGGWVLDPINDAVPNPSNPGHFIKATDRAGNPMHITLNGAGLPADVAVSAGGPYYMCIAATTGQTLDDTAVWRKVVGPITAVQWARFDVEKDNAAVAYVRGNLVYVSSAPGAMDVYIANIDSENVFPPGNPGTWFLVASFNVTLLAELGLFAPGNLLEDLGIWSATTAYTPGNYVVPPRSGSKQTGVIHIERYGESDFLLLGIPIEF